MNPEDPTANPQPPAPTERLTGNLRWLGQYRSAKTPALQQEWEDLATYARTWRDVPSVFVPVGLAL